MILNEKGSNQALYNFSKDCFENGKLNCGFVSDDDLINSTTCLQVNNKTVRCPNLR